MFIARSEYGDYHDPLLLCQLANISIQIAVSSMSRLPATSPNSTLIPFQHLLARRPSLPGRILARGHQARFHRYRCMSYRYTSDCANPL